MASEGRGNHVGGMGCRRMKGIADELAMRVKGYWDFVTLPVLSQGKWKETGVAELVSYGNNERTST